jgi:general secretion pathway protein G
MRKIKEFFMTVENKYARSGFTLAEMMVVIAIIGIIMALVGPGIYSALSKAQAGGAKATLKSIKDGITNYHMDLHQWPVKLVDLIKKPKTLDERLSKKWHGPYFGNDPDIKEMPYDPWDSKYEYKVTPGAQHPYELWSYGENGKGSPKNEWISVWNE